MSLSCPECGSNNLRRAHLRFSDAIRVLALQYPVRCRVCRMRWLISVQEALQLPHAPHRRTTVEKVS
jgi:hypothetical protein